MLRVERVTVSCTHFDGVQCVRVRAGASVFFGCDGARDSKVLDDDWSIWAAEGLKTKRWHRGVHLLWAACSQLSGAHQPALFHTQKMLTGWVY